MSDHVEIVIKACYGGFELSRLAIQEYANRTNRPLEECIDGSRNVERMDPELVKIVKELGDRANSEYSKLKIVRIEGQYARFFSIDEYDGKEWVRIHHDKYKVHTAKAILQDRSLTQTERISRAAAVLGAEVGTGRVA